MFYIIYYNLLFIKINSLTLPNIFCKQTKCTLLVKASDDWIHIFSATKQDFSSEPFICSDSTDDTLKKTQHCNALGEIFWSRIH